MAPDLHAGDGCPVYDAGTGWMALQHAECHPERVRDAIEYAFPDAEPYAITKFDAFPYAEPVLHCKSDTLSDSQPDS